MNRLSSGLFGVSCVLSAVVAAAGGELSERLQPLEPLLGHWEINAEWEEDGGTLWARTVRHAILDGQFIESRTWVRDNGGDVYLRYHAIIGPGSASDAFDMHVFSFDGSHRVEVLSLIPGATPLIESSWALGDIEVREAQVIPTEDEPDQSAWNVWFVRGEDQQLAMDGIWARVPAEGEPAQQRHAATGPMTGLECLLGRWEVDTHWSDGRSLWARTDCALSPSGKYIHSKVWASDEGGPRYPRYRIFHALDDVNGGSDALKEFMFTYRGDIEIANVSLRNEGLGCVVAEIPIPPDGARTVRKTYVVRDEADRRVNDWTVEMVGEDGGVQSIVEGTWVRRDDHVGDIDVIDASRVDSTGDELSSFMVGAVLPAPIDAVYAAWTDAEAWKRVMAPDQTSSAANIDLAIGGRYEWLWDGVVGSNGCRVLSYVPDRMLSFTWNSPPSQKTRSMHTWVVVEFEPVEGGTDVRLTHLGFGEGEDWSETREYFQQAWPRVLERMRVGFGLVDLP